MHNRSIYELNRWQILKHHSVVEYRFVFMLAPILESLYQLICQRIETLPTIGLLFEQFNLVHWLREDLCKIFHPMISRCCVLEMHYAKENGHLTGETPEARFQSYIDLLQSPEFVASFMQKYYLLQEIIDRRATNYLHAFYDFLTNLNQDLPRIQQTFFPDILSLKLHNLQSDGADVHCQGKHVFILTFLTENGPKKIIYKPHHLDPEQIFNTLIEWLNAYTPYAALYPMKLINQSSHGWVEFIEYLPCANPEEVALFYCRVGHLLALAYFFNIEDIHHDNFIAHGAQPVIVDLECFLKPDLREKQSQHTSRYPLATVLNTFLLPLRRGADEEQPGLDISALGFQGKESWFSKKFTWKYAGTDEMHFTRVEAKMRPSFNQPFLNQPGDVDFIQYEANLLTGFKTTYAIFLEHFKQDLQSDFNLKKLATIQTRIIFRATAEYAKLLFESYHPNLLRDRSAYQDHMAWLSERAQQNSDYAKILFAEQKDLSDGDIPFLVLGQTATKC